mmetsp:Transcript_36710/g.121649  ORF Transcript_36710/g.121649 Transcript_36710/m.121649 type:complete len:443 (-) Transcript_36710:375-1703(-)
MQSPSRCHRSGPITDVTDSERVRARASSAQPASSRSAACSSAGAPREGPKAPPASRIRTSSSKTARARAAPSPGTTSVPSSASPSSSDLPAAASAPRSSLASSLTPRRCDSHFAVRAAPVVLVDASTSSERTSLSIAARSSPSPAGSRLAKTASAARAVCCCGPARPLSEAASLVASVSKVLSRSAGSSTEVVRHAAARRPASTSLPQHFWQSSATSGRRTFGASLASCAETLCTTRSRSHTTAPSTSALPHAAESTSTSLAPPLPSTSGKTLVTSMSSASSGRLPPPAPRDWSTRAATRSRRHFAVLLLARSMPGLEAIDSTSGSAEAGRCGERRRRSSTRAVSASAREEEAAARAVRLLATLPSLEAPIASHTSLAFAGSGKFAADAAATLAISSLALPLARFSLTARCRSSHLRSWSCDSRLARSSERKALRCSGASSP